MKNGRVRACTQPHTCGVPCVLNFVLFSAAKMPFDKFGCFRRSNEVIHPIFPPPPKECILLFESSSGTKQKVYNLPWLPTACSIRSTPRPGFQTILQGDPGFPSRPPLSRVLRLRANTSAEQNAWTSPDTLMPTLPGRTPQGPSHGMKRHSILQVPSQLPFPR